MKGIAMQFDREAFRDPSWYHWTATIPLLGMHFAGIVWALPIAAVLCAMMASYYLPQVASLKAFPVQIRLAYLVVLGLGALPWMGWLHLLQLAGTSAMVLAGYCPLARTLMIMPWNRADRFGWSLVRHAFLESPTGGGLFRVMLLGDPAGETSCSLRFTPDDTRIAVERTRAPSPKLG
jgi:hypothetical protein